uniref:Secreted protein n=1 Tax=Heterorhabditis bacteriophora TaxID=37862 RepID=A0A1I7XL73_HETBA
MFCTAIIFWFILGVASESVHWQWREMICKSKDNKNDKDASPCEIVLKESENDTSGRSAPLNTCFEEKANNQSRTYCDILCPGAVTAYRITRQPQNHKSCFSHYTYRLEKRGDNFLMWREGKCRSADIQFTVRCEFSSARAEFITDEQLFESAKTLGLHNVQ